MYVYKQSTICSDTGTLQKNKGTRETTM